MQLRGGQEGERARLCDGDYRHDLIGAEEQRESAGRTEPGGYQWIHVRPESCITGPDQGQGTVSNGTSTSQLRIPLQIKHMQIVL